MASTIKMLEKLTRALGPLIEEVVLVGGTVPALLVTDPAAPSLRPTLDADLVVDSRSISSHAGFETRLRQRGFQLSPPPSCRYTIDDIVVDIMTTSPELAGFSDPWYAEAFATAEHTVLPDGSRIRVMQPALFVATKLSAWHDRGRRDFYAQDLEDVVAVIDGRPALLEEIHRSSPQVRQFLAESFRRLLNSQGFIDSVAAHLGTDSTAAARAEMVIDKMVQITRTHCC